ncbi:hypothetical protein P879_00577 [Paragonimus westermani]|uniref:Tetraspanin n=1 Tax=Paragonimus westermani TaxID=34504 RepID=A0A8T0DS79_9TREM|nr:hypothetical protein P879_00577 [Paragonimus westermani]
MCTCTCRIILFVINAIVCLLGFLLILGGAILTWGKAVMREQLRDHIGPLIERIYGTHTAEQVTNLTDVVLRFTAPFGMVIFGFGVIVFVMCAFGCFGACCNNLLCIKIYIICLALIAVVEIAVLAFYYSNRFMVFHLTRNLLNQTLLNYRSFDSNDPYSTLFNVLMPTLNCCGVTNGSDFENAPDFVRTVNVSEQVITLSYPISCCKMDHQFQILNDTCPTYFTEQNSNIKRGCWQELYPHLVYYGNALAIAGIIVLLFQASLIVMSGVMLAMRQMS